MKTDVAIIGGGASGLAAAVFTARAAKQHGLSLRVTILEKAPRVGRKLLATGNGTCNISNLHIEPRRYHGADAAFALPALSAFTPADTTDFFRSIGVICRARDDGRVYPLSEQAAAVLDCLRAECAALLVEERCDTAVSAIRPQRQGFSLSTNQGNIEAAHVVVAAGGAASPNLGGVSDGYRLLAALGHRKSPLFAAITPICARSEWLRAVKGLRADVHLTLRLNGKTAAQDCGELLFTDYGLSGPVAMQIARVAGEWERRQEGTLTAHVDLLPAWSETEVLEELYRRRDLPGRTLEDLLTGLLHKRIGQTVLRAAGILPLGRDVSTLTEEELAAAAHLIKNWGFSVSGTKGLGAAQVTAGGILTADFNPETLESRLVPRLYAIGEVLDIDGDCGGFNLQWAWSSAHAAAEAIAAKGARP